MGTGEVDFDSFYSSICSIQKKVGRLRRLSRSAVDSEMAAAAEPEIVVEAPDQPVSPKRPSRATKPSLKVREAMQSLEDSAIASRKVSSVATRAVASRGTRVSAGANGSGGQVETGTTPLQKLLEVISEQRNVICELRDVVSRQDNTIRELHRQFQEHQRQAQEHQRQAKEQQRQMESALVDIKTELAEELRQAREQLDAVVRNTTLAASSQTSPRASYAEVARTPPSSQPSGLHTLSSPDMTPSVFTDTLFCTVDTSRVEESERGNVKAADIRKAIETEIRTREDKKNWRCAAVVKEARNPDRVRVVCRDEGEVQLVKGAAQKITVPGVRVLRDQLYPVRVDNANRSAVLDADGNILPGVAEALGAENEVNIAKIAWLSRKDAAKAYGSMVVYVTKGSEARRLLDNRYFHLAGESGYTTEFEPRAGPTQCYNCQEIGHKAFSYRKPQTYGRYVG